MCTIAPPLTPIFAFCKAETQLSPEANDPPSVLSLGQEQPHAMW